MSDDEYDTHCPLCVEEMDLSDQNFLPCPCGYKVCMWCWHHIRENMNGLCPACRTPYNSDPHAFSAVDREDIVKLKKEKRQKEKQEKKTAERVIVAAPGVQVKSTASTVMDRKHLHNYRVVQRNLVYVIGVPAAYASEDTLRKPEFFGQYGKIGKVVIHRNHSSAHSTVSVYVTFTYKEDARASIQSLDGHWLDQNHLLRASFGTTKYCNNFIRGVPCNNPECVYLHDLGDDDDRFTKEEIQAGHSKIPPVPGKDQTLVTGGGGPSGTGKRPLGEPYLPPPVFIQDNYPSSTPLTPAPAPVAAPAASTSTPSAPPGVGVGIVMGVGRPAAVSRSGTATWGTANTIAAIIGGDANAVSGALMSLTDRERDRPRSNSNTPVNFPPLSLSTATSSNNLQEEVYRAGGSGASSSNVPTAVLKRSASSTVSAPGLDPTPAGAAASAAAARAAPIAPPSTTTTTTATSNSTTNNASSAPTANATAPATTSTTTATPAPVAAAVVAPVKPKAKTQKEINAEKKAAAAAARAAEKALMAEAAAAAAAERAALAAAALAAGGDGESKSSGPIVPTPKLSAKQQMLANKAEKAAKAQAAALAAQEVREAARALREAARAAAQAERGNKEETKPQSRAERKAHQAALALAAEQNAAAAAPAASAAPSTPAAPATPVGVNDTQDLSILTQVAAPSIASAPLPSLSSMTDAPPTYAQVRGFNGLSVNSLFPVPASSLSCSVWGNILRATNEDLLINPYGQLKVSMSELLDLMLPPVDAMLSSAPCWPRPLAYYSQGMQPGGVTFSPAGKHVHVRSAADMAALPPMTQMLPPSLQASSLSNKSEGPSLSPAQLAAQAQQHSRVNQLLSAISAESEAAEPSMPVLVPATSVPPLAPPPGVALPGNSTTAGGYVRSNGRTAGPSPLGPPPGVSVSAGNAGGSSSGGTSINALRQLFPGVKMSVSASK